MGIALFRTARGQASIALAGVLIIACAAACEAYLSDQDHEHSRSALSLVEHQRSLARELGDHSREDPAARMSRLAAADAQMEQLLATVERHNQGVDGALIAAVHDAWAIFRTEVALSAALPASDAGATRRLAITLGHLNKQLDALATGYAQRIVTVARAGAGMQAVTLALAAPLLTWAIVAIARGAPLPEPAPGPATPESLGPYQPLAAERPLPAQMMRIAGSPDLAFNTRATRARTEARASSDGGESCRAVSHSAYRQMRSLVSGLGDPHGAPGLASELRLYAADFRQIAGLEVELTIDERAAEGIPASVKPQALNIAREAIANVRRHSEATRVTISLWSDAGSVWLAVADNGSDASLQDQRGADRLGLSLLRARAERIGGELQISAEPGRGTVIMVRLPAVEPAGDQLPGRLAGSPRRAW